MASQSPGWDQIPEQTAVTSDPAAGVITVDIKTFTSRGRVSCVACNCVADATVATRQISLKKVSGAIILDLAASPAFTAAATGYMVAYRGVAYAYATNPTTFPDVEFGPGDILRLIVGLGQAGDNLSAITYSFKEAV